MSSKNLFYVILFCTSIAAFIVSCLAYVKANKNSENYDRISPTCQKQTKFMNHLRCSNQGSAGGNKCTSSTPCATYTDPSDSCQGTHLACFSNLNKYTCEAAGPDCKWGPQLLNTGCKGAQGLGGEFAICSGAGQASSQKCMITPKLTSDIKNYYGKTNASKIDPDGQYYKDLDAAYTSATEALQNTNCITTLLQHKIQPAVMVDLDDTVWNTFAEATSPGTCYQKQSGPSPSPLVCARKPPSNIKSWTEKTCTNPTLLEGGVWKYNPPFTYSASQFNCYAQNNEMATIEQTVKFLKYVRKLGAIAILVTGRSAKDRSQADFTKVQLDAIPGLVGNYWKAPNVNQGQVQALNGVFMHGGGNTRSKNVNTWNASTFKQATRCWIEQNLKYPVNDYPIEFVMSIGDQWSDANGKCSGIRVKLPNPMYYIP